MAINSVPYNPLSPDEPNPNDSPRFWECFQCVYSRRNILRLNKEEPLFLCVILDVENVEIVAENDKIANSNLHKPLKKCIYHPEAE